MVNLPKPAHTSNSRLLIALSPQRTGNLHRGEAKGNVIIQNSLLNGHDSLRLFLLHSNQDFPKKWEKKQYRKAKSVLSLNTVKPS